VKDREVAQKMNKYMELNTIGVSKDSQLRAARILGAVADGYEREPAGAASGDASLLFHYARRQMTHRWSTLRAAVMASGIFSLPDEVTGFCTFAKDTVTANPGTYAHCTIYATLPH
jgi:L-tryptophan--pyruvate aminotransferase